MSMCPAAWCGKPISSVDKLFCNDHWYKIPMFHRAQLLHTRPNTVMMDLTIRWLARKEGYWPENRAQT